MDVGLSGVTSYFCPRRSYQDDSVLPKAQGTLLGIESMQIALIKPPSNARKIYPVLGLGYIAAVLKQNDYGVEFIDTCLIDFPFAQIKNNPRAYWNAGYPLNWEAIEGYFRERNTHIDVAFIGGSFTADINNSFRIATLLKAINKRCITVLGGTHVSALAKETLEECPDIDFVVRGEGERVCLDLVKAIEGRTDIFGISGFSYRKPNGEIHVSERCEPIMDLDQLPFPARELMPMEQYRYIWKEALFGPAPGLESDPAGVIFSSRGCFGECIFCASNEISKRRMRFRSPKNVISEIEFLIRNYKIKNITFVDDTFTVNIKRCCEISDYLGEIKLPWYCYSRIDTVSPELLTRMKKNGCKILNFGLESGDERILGIMKKGITLRQIQEGLKIVKKSSIKYVASFTIGHPGETKKTIKKTVRLAKSFGGFDAGVFRITPYPGTPLYEEAIKNNWMRRVNWDLYDDTSELEPFYVPPGWKTKGFHQACLRAQQSVRNYYHFKRLFILSLLWKRLQRTKNLPGFKNLFFNRNGDST